ncbi:MAG: hypothetical protein AAGB48_06890, partial [Planctomycetota bacterium]
MPVDALPCPLQTSWSPIAPDLDLIRSPPAMAKKKPSPRPARRPATAANEETGTETGTEAGSDPKQRARLDRLRDKIDDIDEQLVR